jgi:hypothetical protein
MSDQPANTVPVMHPDKPLLKKKPVRFKRTQPKDGKKRHYLKIKNKETGKWEMCRADGTRIQSKAELTNIGRKIQGLGPKHKEYVPVPKKPGPKKKVIKEWVCIRVQRVKDSSSRHWKYPKLRGLFAGRVRRTKKGKSTGMSLCEWLAITFDANELLKKEKKLTDESILQAVIKEFSGISKTVDDLKSRKRTIGYLRAKFNRGKLTGVVPKRQSHRWDEYGNIIPGNKRRHGERSGPQTEDDQSVKAVDQGLRTDEKPEGLTAVDAAGVEI